MVEIRKFKDDRGRIPYDQWFEDLKDRNAKAQIAVRIRRLSLGLEGDWKSVGKSVRELRVPTGKGYRVYYAWDGATAVLLLCGGDKSTQSDDIAKAKDCWRKYRAQQG